MLKAWNSRSYDRYKRRLSYLESDGNSYLVLNKNIKKESKITIDFNNSNMVGVGGIFCATTRTSGTNDHSNMTFLNNGWYGIKNRIVYGFSHEGVLVEPTTGRFVARFYEDHASIEMNGVETLAAQKGGNRYDLDGVYLFYTMAGDQDPNSVHREELGITPKGLRIYSFSVDGVMSCFPVMSLKNEPCMYDEVSGQLFYNQGTGKFKWGELET